MSIMAQSIGTHMTSTYNSHSLPIYQWTHLATPDHNRPSQRVQEDSAAQNERFEIIGVSTAMLYSWLLMLDSGKDVILTYSASDQGKCL